MLVRALGSATPAVRVALESGRRRGAEASTVRPRVAAQQAQAGAEQRLEELGDAGRGPRSGEGADDDEGARVLDMRVRVEA